MTDVFYIYVHKKLTTGEIFYVGKGKGGRDISKSGRSAHWRNIVKKHGYKVERIYELLSEDEAYKKEVECISSLRADGKNICNIANGGNGGLSGIKLSKTHKEKLRSAKLGKKQLPDHARKSALAKVGKKQPRAAVDYVIGMKKKKVINSSGEIFESATAAAEYISKILGINASQGNISMCARGQRSNAYGRTWSYDTSKTPIFKPTEYAVKKIKCSNGMKFISVQDAKKWVISWRGEANNQCISQAARKGSLAYGFNWEYVK